LKYKVAIMAFLVLIFLLTSVSWAQESLSNDFTSQISSKTAYSLEPLIKGGGRGGFSTSSSKSKVDDEQIDNSTGNETSSSEEFPWWIVAILFIVVILAIIVIWYLFLR